VVQAQRADLLARFARPVFEIELVPDEIPQLAALAERLEATGLVERTALDGARLRVTARDLDRARREVLPMLAGLAVVRFEMLGATLEDIFLNLTDPANSQPEVTP